MSKLCSQEEKNLEVAKAKGDWHSYVKGPDVKTFAVYTV